MGTPQRLLLSFQAHCGHDHFRKLLSIIGAKRNVDGSAVIDVYFLGEVPRVGKHDLLRGGQNS